MGAAGSGSGGGGGMGAGGAGTGLGSAAAQMGFAHGAALQQQQAAQQAAAAAAAAGQANGRMRDVWKHNLAQEMALLRNLVERYPYISMFPGIVARPMGDFNSKASYHYQTVRCNVDLLNIIQLGITLFSANGDPVEATPDPELMPPSMSNKQFAQPNLVVCPCTWTFHFQFSLENDMYNDDSIGMLRKAGLDLDKLADQGIPPEEFGSLLITSGLTFSPDVHWISFHSGYDFAYLVKLMWQRPLPHSEAAYKHLVDVFFPRLLDVKFMLRAAQKQHQLRQPAMGPGNTTNPTAQSTPGGAHALSILTSLGTKSGLQDLADELGCPRQGIPHQAGSDAWLTGAVFWALKTKVFGGDVPEGLEGQMWGLTGVGAPAGSALQQAVLGLAAQGGGAVQGGMPGLQQGGQQQGQQGLHHTEQQPSTPTANPVGLAGAGATVTPGPGQGSAGTGAGAGTPGPGQGMGGVFGNFTYGGK
ncbi:ribonuclease H-like domain-containing protein [Lineolata rhizophorae]|uniref:poly(A)-specific ribonuclease n=1 Tax=Lineolata rhizophorae TaxID=578093 RepID=A0A6A6P015_9PEZI|nr:ribonuclease H-like domain-containing protein [Lineolata rhizophorae]